MTNKEIIIDGVDVSKCKHYKINGKCRIPHYQQGIRYVSCNCDEWDCYYKQLKRKEQECENLKAEEKYLKQCCQKAGEELAKHSFEYDGKEKNLVVQAIELNEKYEEFKKALEEIEEVTKINCEEFCGRKFEDCNDFLCTSKNILDIINKAKGESNEQ